MSRKASEQLFDFIRFPIIVSVLRIEDVRSRTYQKPLAPNRHARRKWNAGQKNLRTIVSTVPIIVGQATNLPATFSCRSTLWIVIHLGHPKSAVRPKGNRHRALNKRLRGNQLHSKSRLCSQRSKRLVGSQRVNSISLRDVNMGGKLLLQLSTHSIDDDFFQSGRIGSGNVVIDHRPAPFVTSFTKNTFGWNVAWAGIRIGIQPDSASVQFLFESQCIIDNDFAW